MVMRASAAPRQDIMSNMTKMNKFLLTLWCTVSLFWAAGMAHRCHLAKAISTYGDYYEKINDINNGVATSYEKKDYLAAGPYLEAAGRDFALFILAGLVLPCLALWFCAWLLKNE